MTLKKKGIISKVVIDYLLPLVAFVAILTMLIPFTTTEFRLGIRETVCQMTLSLQKTLPDIPFVDVSIAVCSTERLKITKDTFDDARKKDETLEEGGMRYILDKMRRCKSITGVDEPSWFQFWARDKCYLCYTLEMDEDVPAITTQQLSDFAIYKTPKGKKEVYLRDLGLPGFSNYHHLILFNTNILPNKRYAIVYADHSKPANWAIKTKLATACALGFLPALTPITIGLTPYTFILACGTGDILAISDLLHADTNKIILTELETLINDEGKHECSEYAY